MTNCESCGAAGVALLYPLATDYITGDRFEVWRCAACGWGRTQPSPADLGKYYPAKYRQYSPLIAAVLEVLYRRRVRSWTKFFPRPGSAFEMGCGNGTTLNALRRGGWQVLGSERTEDAARIAREQFGLSVVAGGLENVDPTARFDLVLLLQVLEHLDDPLPTLTAMATLLKPGGKFIIGVPNFGSWQANFGRAGWFHLDVPRHLHHHTLNSLTALVSRVGLRIDAVSYVSPEHDPYGWIQSALSRVDGGRNRLTRLLMRLDPPGPVNLLHLAAGGVIGLLAVPLSILSWIARRGALIEIICSRTNV